MHFLFVKHGALGDVVRTSYLAAALVKHWGPGLRISWLTADAAQCLLRPLPWVHDVWTTAERARRFEFDRLFSFDDERSVLQAVAGLKTRALSGAYLDDRGVPAYTDDAAEWFDMGLLSRFGKARADELKRTNRRGHAQIFADIVGVDRVEPCLTLDADVARAAARLRTGAERLIGVNPFAGGRWPSKELPADDIRPLLDGLAARWDRVVLLGAGADRQRNLQLVQQLGDARVAAADTDLSPAHLAAAVAQLDALISSDSLAMHLAIAQGVPTVAFFGPTSAAEIDDFGIVEKVLSTSSDYCSYRPVVDNSSITAERVLAALDCLCWRLNRAKVLA
jgi:heptosyltransferase-2